MSEKRKAIPPVDSNLFTENFNRFPAAELLKYAGQYTGWSLDGVHILASGADEQEMEERLKERGIDPSQVVGMYIPRPDEALLGGFFAEQCEWAFGIAIDWCRCFE